MKKRIVFVVLILAVFVLSVTAEEIIGTIIFDPQRDGSGYRYSISTGANSRVADKFMYVSYGNVGEAASILSNYLVKGAKVIYENGRLTISGGINTREPMRNTMGEQFGAPRLITIIMEDGYYMELTEILDEFTISWYFPYLFWKLDREGRR